MDQCKRRKWYKECLHWVVEDWAKVILSDESSFQAVNHKGRIYVKRFATEKYGDVFPTKALGMYEVYVSWPDQPIYLQKHTRITFDFIDTTIVW